MDMMKFLSIAYFEGLDFHFTPPLGPSVARSYRISTT